MRLSRTRPLEGRKPARTPLKKALRVFNCTSPSWCGAFNSREDDEPCINYTSTLYPSSQAHASELKHPEAACMRLHACSPSSAQPSGWIRRDLLERRPQWIAGVGAGSLQRDEALPMATLLSTTPSWQEELDDDRAAAAAAFYGAPSFSTMPASSSSSSSSSSVACLPLAPPSAAHTHSSPSSSAASGSGSSAASCSTALPAGAAAWQADQLWTLTNQPGIDMFMAGPLAWGKLTQVFVILFGVDEWETEGIYSIHSFSDVEEVPQETIIAFETEEDAQRYACLLEATMDHLPCVCSMTPRELMDFCGDLGYHCRLEPANSLLIPPDCNVGVTDWERGLRLREGQWAVLSDEPDCGADAASSPPQPLAVSPAAVSVAASGLLLKAPPAAPPASAAPSPAGHASSRGAGNGTTLAKYASMSGGELATIRQRLERLLADH